LGDENARKGLNPTSVGQFAALPLVKTVFRSVRTTVTIISLGSLSKGVFEQRMPTGSGLSAFLGSGLAQICRQIVSIRVKTVSKTNFIASRHIKREKALVWIDVRRSDTSMLKLPIILAECIYCGVQFNTKSSKLKSPLHHSLFYPFHCQM